MRLCARLTGDSAAADDLAQETLLEAWRSQQALRDPDRFSAWLTGIAHNVCRRWMRRQLSPLARSLDDGPDAEVTLRDEWLADSEELELELQRKELAALLDRALALLPKETRDALLAHYLDEAPLAQIAERLGVQASAVAVRLRRGRLALRRLLTTELRGEMAAYSVHAEGSTAWEETPLWCVICGFCIGPINPLFSTIEFERVPAEKRARVFGAGTAGSMLATPLGALVAGGLAAAIGIWPCILLFGVVYTLATMSLLVTPALRRLDIQRQVFPTKTT